MGQAVPHTSPGHGMAGPRADTLTSGCPDVIGPEQEWADVDRGETPEGVITVCQLGSTQYNMDIQVGDIMVDAVVDTAAQATIISDAVYDSLAVRPKKVKDITLLTSGRKLSMKGFIAGPVSLKIGTRWYEEQVYVAPIEQEMLLGFDILYQRGAVLDMSKGILKFDGQELDLGLQGQDRVSSVARVTSYHPTQWLLFDVK